MSAIDKTHLLLFNTSSFTDDEVLEEGGIAADICSHCGWERIWTWQSGIDGSVLELVNPSGDDEKCC